MNFGRKRLIAVGFISLMGVTLLTGCAFGTREVLLKNTQTAQALQSSKRNHEICFDSLTDLRPDSAIGHVQNSYGIKTAEVKAINKVSDWINKEIKNQLRMAGYTVNENCAADRNSMIEIEGKIVKVYTTAYMKYLGEVTIEAFISLDSSTVINRKYSGYKKGGTNWAASSDVFGELLEESLKSVTSQLINDIDSIDVGKYLKVESNIITAMSKSSSSSNNDSANISHGISNIENKSISTNCPNQDSGIVILSGKRSLTSIKDVLDSIKANLNSIYNDRFELNPSLSGEICVNFSVSSEGKTGNIKILSNSLQDKPIEEKLLSSLGKIQFKNLATEEEPTLVSYSFKFDAKSAKAAKKGVVAVIAVLLVIPLIISIINIKNLANSPY